MVVIKRDGTEVPFNKNKIYDAVLKAMLEVDKIKPQSDIKSVSDSICNKLEGKYIALNRAITVEEIQDDVETCLMESGKFDAAKAYITYRYKHNELRNANSTDGKILSLVNGVNETVIQENSNKNPAILSTQRDYIAGEVSRDISNRLLLPEDVVKAHEEGIIHFHDADYYPQKMHNCCLTNLEDMLQNGTVINGTLVEKPHSFATACNVATQIMAQVASCQYGGQSESLTHLAPFVDISRKKIRAEVDYELNLANGTFDKDYGEVRDAIVERRVKEEIRRGVQTIQYQINTLMTTNGQAPFVTIFMYLNEAKDPQTKADLALIIEEVLNQRIQGVKNEKGIWITPAFPKLIYVLEEDNITEDVPFWYLTELAAKCTAKRMVPDYISEKKMFELKGDVYTCMGCVAEDEVITYRMGENTFVESFGRAWNRLAQYFEIKTQPGRIDDKYIDLTGVEIYDCVSGWTKCYRMIRNNESEMLRLKFSNGRLLDCTPDHPFETENRGEVSAANLSQDDIVRVDKSSSWTSKTIDAVDDYAWMLGVLLCDSSYASHVCVSVAAHGEDEIVERLGKCVSKFWGAKTKTILQERDRKGTYLDVVVEGDGSGKAQSICSRLEAMFEGRSKMHRHIPNEVFSWSRNAQMSFLAGMIDADGYINDNHRVPVAQIGSVNKELAIQQALLAQRLGMRASIYQNHYKGDGRADTVRYHVAFCPTDELVELMACEKKRAKFKEVARQNHSISDENFATLTSVERLAKKQPSYDVTTESEHFTVSGIYSHNCRSFLTPDRFTDAGVGNVANAGNYEPGKHKYYGRFNQGVVTINLPDVGLSAHKDFDLFWKIFDERLELCHKALRARHERLKGTLSDASPIHWQYGALARLKKGEPIDKLLYNGYSTISLGYAGLYECVKAMTGKSHTEDGGKEFAIAIMQYMNDKCAKWKSEENIDYSIYGTPIESTTYKFAKALQNRFGVIEGVTDKSYITNSYHVHVTEKISAFDKLKFEAEFQALSPGGAISYVEVSNLTGNIPAVLSVMRYIYDNIMYAELNTKSDYCQECGYDGEIQIVPNDDGKLIWKCPNCGNEDKNKMNVARRTCGYIGLNDWNQGRTQEIKERYVHLGGDE